MPDRISPDSTIALSNGFRLPVMGYGTYPCTDALLEAIPTAIRHGYRLIDSSDNYGDEGLVGQALARSGADAENVVVVTKFSQPARTFELEACFDESERKLGRSIDVYLLHWPYPYLWKEQWRRMEQLYLKGRCSAIGVCNFEEDKLDELLAFCEVPPLVNQFESHPLFQQRNLIDACHAEGIVTMSYSPVARMAPELLANETLARIGERHGKLPVQLIMRWNIQHGRIPIPASKGAQHIVENVDVFDFVLSDEEMASIDALERGARIRYDPKTRFSSKQRLKFLLHAICRH